MQYTLHVALRNFSGLFSRFTGSQVSSQVSRQANGRAVGVLGSSLLLVSVILAAGCSSRALTNAPVEERGTSASRPVSATPAPPPVVDPKLLPGYENAGNAGYYTVKPGDTLIRIGLDNGQNWRDLVKWNGLDKPNLIEVGQVLRVVLPGIDPNAVSTRAVTTAKVETRPLLDAKNAAPAGSAAVAFAGSSRASICDHHRGSGSTASTRCANPTSRSCQA